MHARSGDEGGEASDEVERLEERIPQFRNPHSSRRTNEGVTEGDSSADVRPRKVSRRSGFEPFPEGVASSRRRRVKKLVWCRKEGCGRSLQLGRILGEGLEFSCGTCVEASSEDAVSVIGGQVELCGYTSQVAEQIVQNDDRLCARILSSQSRFELDLLSYLPPPFFPRQLPSPLQRYQGP